MLLIAKNSASGCISIASHSRAGNNNVCHRTVEGQSNHKQSDKIHGKTSRTVNARRPCAADQARRERSAAAPSQPAEAFAQASAGADAVQRPRTGVAPPGKPWPAGVRPFARSPTLYSNAENKSTQSTMQTLRFFCEGRQARFKTIVVFLFSKPFSGLIIRPLMSDMLRRSEMKSRSFSALCLEKKNCICKPYCSIMQNIKKMVNAAIE